MKLPRDVAGDDVVKGLRRVGYEVSRQRGDHVYMTTQRNGEHHVSVPLHNPVKVGTLRGILRTVSIHLELELDELLVNMRL
mgnify:CR=1 FL=1